MSTEALYTQGLPNLITPLKDTVVMSSLTQPPARGPDVGLSYLIRRSSYNTPSLDTPTWEPIGHEDLCCDEIHFVPTNGVAQAELHDPAYLVTARLNGCVAVASAYREGVGGPIESFHMHIDPENITQTNRDGRLKASKLVTDFAGEQAVRVAVAYPKAHNMPPLATEQPNTYRYPITCLTEDLAKSLPPGSRVTFIPYDVASFAEIGAFIGGSCEDLPGHTLAVGLDGAGLIDFSWNGKKIKVGEDDTWSPNQRKIAQRLNEELVAEIGAEFASNPLQEAN